MCIERREVRPSAEELLNSEFMTDTKSANNEKPCSLFAPTKVVTQGLQSKETVKKTVDTPDRPPTQQKTVK